MQNNGSEKQKTQRSPDDTRNGSHSDPAREEKRHQDGGDHGGHKAHAAMFRQRFWISLILSIPVLLYSEALQGWIGFTMPPLPWQ